ncbi:hypothetical protein HOF56_03580 [Candidatus Peribacteria bacterium]|jgi:hypothetical protein|nr:hypothetical protein [Candidatus Peribacteria bacterium]MBT4021008.1 hypothetical protein [Candidatus Peribacteria bacterium]MBT4240907.1 hypothetical protein [Candidatus Peribacteria bacterium]MBT4474130.1 hypothetical protein [Candidatus Peribacteria bacterium]
MRDFESVIPVSGENRTEESPATEMSSKEQKRMAALQRLEEKLVEVFKAIETGTISAEDIGELGESVMETLERFVSKKPFQIAGFIKSLDSALAAVNRREGPSKGQRKRSNQTDDALFELKSAATILFQTIESDFRPGKLSKDQFIDNVGLKATVDETVDAYRNKTKQEILNAASHFQSNTKSILDTNLERARKAEKDRRRRRF